MVEKMAPQCTPAEWQEQLQTLKAPDEHVGEVDEDYLGTLFYQVTAWQLP